LLSVKRPFGRNVPRSARHPRRQKAGEKTKEPPGGAKNKLRNLKRRARNAETTDLKKKKKKSGELPGLKKLTREVEKADSPTAR